MKRYRYVSADSHVHLSTHRWAHRVPEKFRDRLPREIELPDGREGTIDEEGRISYGGTGHFAGQGPENFDPAECGFLPARRPGSHEVPLRPASRRG